MAQRKNWKYTRNGVEYTLSVNGLMKFHRGGWHHYASCDSMHMSDWMGEPWEETVLITAFRKCSRTTFKQECIVEYLNTSNGKKGWEIISAPTQYDKKVDFQHLDE